MRHFIFPRTLILFIVFVIVFCFSTKVFASPAVQIYPTIASDGHIDISTLPNYGCSHTHSVDPSIVASIYSLYKGDYLDQTNVNQLAVAFWPSYSDNCQMVFAGYSLEDTGHTILGDGNYWLALGADNTGVAATTWNWYFVATRTNGVWSSITPTCVTNCFSNVLFFPGLMGSRLYEQRADGSEDQLWEPNGNSDVEDLYLNTDGTSKNSSIYTRDVIKETNTPVYLGLAGQNIYKSFSNIMDGLVSDGKIKEWQPFAYDWRESVEDVVNTPQKYQNGNISYLTATLQSLVASSKNGKVTIIAHSNGGLIAKALLKKLQDDKVAGINNDIDNIDVLILVAVPEIGTASAVPAMLHGYDQRMALGFLEDESHARELGRNMPSAYGVLPSKEYINHVSASPATFIDFTVPSGVTTNLVQTFGSAINSFTEYKDFLFGAEGRVNPAINQMNLPISLSQSLFSKAESLHDNIDAWTPPTSMRVIEVAGWGLDTVASFEYFPIPCTVSIGCGYTLDERPTFTINGDKTVVVPSAQYMNFLGKAEKYWVDLPEHNHELGRFRRNREHKDILEVTQLNNLVKSIINKEDIVTDNVLKTTEPTDTSNRLRLSIHSPVTLDAYDAYGAHTGKVCPPNGSSCYLEENIPNSSYLEFGEGKYLNIPEDEIKNVKLQGTDTGTFTYNSEKVLPSGVSSISSFVDIPVTIKTQAEITLNQNTQIPELKLDVAGDGVFDFTLAPKATFDPVAYLQIMKNTIDSFYLPPAKKNVFNNRVNDIIRLIQNNRMNQAKLKVGEFKSILENELVGVDPKFLNSEKWLKNSYQPVLLDLLNQLLDNLK